MKSFEPEIRKSVGTGVFRFLANETLARGVLELFDRVQVIENGGPEKTTSAPEQGQDPLFTMDLRGVIPGFTERISITSQILSTMAAQEREGKIKSNLAQQIISLQDSHHKSLVREHDLIQELEKAKRRILALTDYKDHFLKIASERLDEISALRNNLDEATRELASIDAVLGNRMALEMFKTRADKINHLIQTVMRWVGPTT